MPRSVAVVVAICCACALGQVKSPARPQSRQDFLRRLVIAATERTNHDVRYLGGNVPHIGIVLDRKGPSGRYMIEHNIGQGPRVEDVLFNWKMTGHYRYYGPAY